MKHIAILGSTGSIGVQALEVIDHHPDLYRITTVAAYHNDQLLEAQINKYSPLVAVLVDEQAAERLNKRYRGNTKILSGADGLLTAASLVETDIVLTSMVGAAGIRPTLAAIEAGKDIALANKETLVAAGEIVTALAAQTGSRILPVDSEHSALFQCLQGEQRSDISRLILTASGGPFRGYSRDRLQTVTVAECLRHPNWTMGKKITVDSATLINKGLEVMEAKWLFGVDLDKIEVVIHPQSIVHSMVEFIDNSTIAQLGRPDMRVAIQYAFTWPERMTSPAGSLDWRQASKLEFMPPDKETFTGLALAYQVGKAGGTLPCVFNAANEVAVNAFLDNKLSFLHIYDIIETTVANHSAVQQPGVQEIFAADCWARQYAQELTEKIGR